MCPLNEHENRHLIASKNLLSFENREANDYMHHLEFLINSHQSRVSKPNEKCVYREKNIQIARHTNYPI